MFVSLKFQSVSTNKPEAFRVTDYLETSALNDTKINLNTTRLKAPIVVTTIAESLLSLSSHLPPAVFEIQGCQKSEMCRIYLYILNSNNSWSYHLYTFYNSRLLVTLMLNREQEAQGLGALFDKMDDNDHINWITQSSRCIFHSKT